MASATHIQPDPMREVEDEARRLPEQHILVCSAALKKGLPVKGYFVWTLMDNFEWAWVTRAGSRSSTSTT